jgi:hypothetical protein
MNVSEAQKWLGVAVAVFLPASAMACSCAEFSQREALHHATVVFRARAVRVDHLRVDASGELVRIEPEEKPRALKGPTIVTMDVATYWKGSVQRSARVHANAEPVMCDGYRFEEGKEYIVYAHMIDPHWWDLRKLVAGATIYEVADCPLRVVRDDVQREAKLLGLGRSPAKK